MSDWKIKKNWKKKIEKKNIAKQLSVKIQLKGDETRGGQYYEDLSVMILPKILAHQEKNQWKK